MGQFLVTFIIIWAIIVIILIVFIFVLIILIILVIFFRHIETPPIKFSSLLCEKFEINIQKYKFHY
jgi:hypothetical protein